MLGYDLPRLHAALNDLPPAILFAAVLFDLLAFLTRRAAFRQVGFWTLLLGVLGTAAAVLSGLAAEDHIAHGEAVHQLMETHETLALTTLGIFTVLAIWRIARETRMAGLERTFSVGLELIGFAVLFATAAWGGKMVFDHAAGIPTAVLESEIHERSEGHHHHGAGGDASAEEAEQLEHDETAGADSTAPAAQAPAGHSHAPGTPPHKD
jgi:uncharacterized membrane protein